MKQEEKMIKELDCISLFSHSVYDIAIMNLINFQFLSYFAKEAII